MSYPNISQFQEFLRKKHKLEGNGYFLQKALFNYLSNNKLFENLLVRENLFNQEISLSKVQYFVLLGEEKQIIEEAIGLIKYNEYLLNLEKNMRGETEQEKSERIIKETRDSFKFLKDKFNF